MSPQKVRDLSKALLSRVPYAAAFYQSVLARHRIPSGGYDLDRLSTVLPDWIRSANRERRTPTGKARQILIVANLKWWLEHAVTLGLLFHSQGHEIELAYLPYRRWSEPVPSFDRQRQSAYMERKLSILDGSILRHDLSEFRPAPIPQSLSVSIDEQSMLDVQYTLQREIIGFESDEEARDLLSLREDRNRVAAGALLGLMDKREFDTVLIPNGSILEYGAAYRTARWLKIPTVTYEFAEQSERIWLARDQEVMRLPTDELWAQRGSVPLTEEERAEIEALYRARRGGQAWSVFARPWQKRESAGAAEVRRALELDPDRPVVLLCTNVVGDSLALDRQIFTRGMADWLEESVRYFADRPDSQLVVRVHPGELLGAGHPSIDIVRGALPELPDMIKLVPPESSINTYDLIELAHLGLAYTTTVGMEMAMYGVPVVVAGDTHYRGKGFTDDPLSLDAYRAAIMSRLAEPPGRRLSQDAVELAWRYAHRFFFEFPFGFPWHLISFWDDIDERPFEEVLAVAATKYRPVIQAMTGGPIDWTVRAGRIVQEQPA